MIKGERVRLRPVEQTDLPTIAQWAREPDSISSYNNFGLRPASGSDHGYQETGWLDENHGSLMVISHDGEILGDMSYHKTHYGPNSGSRPYNIGINLLPAHRGKGYGSEAQRLLAAYLFETYPVARVEAQTDVTNIPEQRSLEKAGFTREGVLRKAQWRSGDWHDLVVYSKLRGE